MKIAIEKGRNPSGYGIIPWTACEPFIENSRAVLIHRPRHVSTHNSRNQKYKPHIGVKCWCGTQFAGSKKFTFLDAPPDGKLLCARCEEKAVDAGMPTSNALTGKHIHIGKVVAVQLCCKGEPHDPT